MATLLKESNFSSSNNFKIRLEYSYLQDTANNKTTITYYNYFVSMNGYSGSGANTTGYINNAIVGSTTSIGVNEKKLLGKKSVVVTHNQDGTFPNTSYSASISSPWNIGTASVSGTLTKNQIPKINRYPQITSAPDFNDEENPTIQYTTALGFEGAIVKAGIKVGNTIVVSLRDVVVADAQYTFELTTSEKNALRNATPNSNTLQVTFLLRTTYNSTNYDSTSNKTLTIVNANPTTSTTTTEQNANVVSVLGGASTNYVIANASTLLFNTTTNALKGSSISSVSVNGQLATLDTTYKTTLSNVQTGTFVVNATDTRGNASSETITKTLIAYVSPKINTWSIERETMVSSDFILDANITCFSGTFNTTQNTATVKYSIDNETWVTIPSSAYTFIDNTITISNYQIEDLIPYTDYGTFYLKIEDLLLSNQEYKQISKGIETYSWGENDLQVNGDIFIADENGENAVNIMNKITQKGRGRVYKYNTTNQTIESTTDVDITGMSTTINTYGGDIFVCASLNVTQSANVCTVSIYVDNVSKGELIELSSASGRQQTFGMIILTGISAGSHTFTLKAKVQNSGNVATFHSYNSQQFVVAEL